MAAAARKEKNRETLELPRLLPKLRETPDPLSKKMQSGQGTGLVLIDGDH